MTLLLEVDMVLLKLSGVDDNEDVPTLLDCRLGLVDVTTDVSVKDDDEATPDADDPGLPAEDEVGSIIGLLLPLPADEYGELPISELNATSDDRDSRVGVAD